MPEEYREGGYGKQAFRELASQRKFKLLSPTNVKEVALIP